jgi:TolB protein
LTSAARIAFVRNDSVSALNSIKRLYIMNADGSGQTRVSQDIQAWDIAWSPDGQSIAFTSDRANKNGIRPHRDIFVMDAKGLEQRNLTRNATACVSEFPAWSFEGTQIAFDSNCQGAWFQVYVMRADGSHFQRITNSEGHDRHPTWSPDGRQITFDSN